MNSILFIIFKVILIIYNKRRFCIFIVKKIVKEKLLWFGNVFFIIEIKYMNICKNEFVILFRFFLKGKKFKWFMFV